MKRVLVLACLCTLAVVAPAGAASPRRHSAKSSAAVSALDRWYLKTSIRTDLAEIAGGNAALAKSRDAAVDKLAQTLVTDHTALLASGEALARKLRIKVPSSPSPPQLWEMQVLSLFSGVAFNHLFATQEVAGHEQAILDTRLELAAGTNARIRAAALAALAMLKMHLALAEAAAKANS